MDTIKVTEIRRRPLFKRPVGGARRHRRYPLILAMLLALPLTINSAGAQLTSDQIVQQLERRFDGKVVSITPPDGDQFYQVRFLTSKARIVLLTVDATSGAVVNEIKQKRLAQ